MIIGLGAVLVMGVVFLTMCQIYSADNLNHENYVAGSESEI